VPAVRVVTYVLNGFFTCADGNGGRLALIPASATHPLGCSA
jgi:hypothetical protein